MEIDTPTGRNVRLRKTALADQVIGNLAAGVQMAPAGWVCRPYSAPMKIPRVCFPAVGGSCGSLGGLEGADSPFPRTARFSWVLDSGHLTYSSRDVRWLSRAMRPVLTTALCWMCGLLGFHHSPRFFLQLCSHPPFLRTPPPQLSLYLFPQTRLLSFLFPHFLLRLLPPLSFSFQPYYPVLYNSASSSPSLFPSPSTLSPSWSPSCRLGMVLRQ